MCCFGMIVDGSAFKKINKQKKKPTPKETRKHIYSNTPAEEDGRKGLQSINIIYICFLTHLTDSL